MLQLLLMLLAPGGHTRGRLGHVVQGARRARRAAEGGALLQAAEQGREALPSACGRALAHGAASRLARRRVQRAAFARGARGATAAVGVCGRGMLRMPSVGVCGREAMRGAAGVARHSAASVARHSALGLALSDEHRGRALRERRLERGRRRRCGARCGLLAPEAGEEGLGVRGLQVLERQVGDARVRVAHPLLEARLQQGRERRHPDLDLDLVAHAARVGRGARLEPRLAAYAQPGGHHARRRCEARLVMDVVLVHPPLGAVGERELLGAHDGLQRGRKRALVGAQIGGDLDEFVPVRVLAALRLLERERELLLLRAESVKPLIDPQDPENVWSNGNFGRHLELAHHIAEKYLTLASPPPNTFAAGCAIAAVCGP